MNWQSIAFDWNRARAFLVTAEEGSLSAAARALGMTQPTLGRQVAALEQELGVVLFERVGKTLQLTPNGLDLLEYVQAMGDAANSFSLAASGRSNTLDGSVCISASEAYTAYILPPIVAKLRRLHPGIKIELVATSQVSDLQRREADIALRHFRPSQADLIAKKIKDVGARLYANADYLNTIAPLHTVEHLSQAEFISFDNTGALIDGLNALGLKLDQSNFPVVTESYLTHWEMVKQGLGIGIMLEQVGDAEPQVQRVLPDLTPIGFPIWLTCHSELKTSRRVRAVFDLLAQELIL